MSSRLVISPDGPKIAYRADQNLNDVFEPFVVDIANPGVTTRVNRKPATGGDVLVDGYRFSPASVGVAYVADEDTNNIDELYLVELASPAVSIKLNGTLVAGGDIDRGIAFSLDGAQVVYTADQDTDEVVELYQVSRATPGDTVKLNSTLTTGGNVLFQGLETSSDGKQLVYLADQDVDEDFELYMVDLETPGSTVKASPPYHQAAMLPGLRCFRSRWRHRRCACLSWSTVVVRVIIMFAKAVFRVVLRPLSQVLLSLMLVVPVTVVADEVVAKTIFLVDEDDSIVAANTATGQFFSLSIHAKEKIRQRYVANGVAILVTNQRFAGVGSYPSGWSSLRRMADEKVVSAEVVDKSALLVTSDRILTFNGDSGSWSETRR